MEDHIKDMEASRRRRIDDLSSSSSSEETSDFSDASGTSEDDADYGQGSKILYLWYVVLKLNKQIINDRLYKTKGEAMSTAINILNNYSSSDATTLIRKVKQLSSENLDDVQLSQGTYAVSFIRLHLYT